MSKVIDVNAILMQPVVAKPAEVTQTKVIPEGFYTAILTKVSDWTGKNITIPKLWETEGSEYLLDDEGNRIVKALNASVDIAEANLTFKVVNDDQDIDGTLIWEKISTFPNTPWILPQFAGAFGGVEDGDPVFPMMFSDYVGAQGVIRVVKESYTKKVTDKDTGIEMEEEVEVNRIKGFYPSKK